MLGAFAVAFGAGALGHDLGTPLAMGPGMFPLILAGLLGVIAVAIVVRSFVAPSQEPVPSPSTPETQVDEVATALLEGTDALADRPTRPERFGAIPWRAGLLLTAAVLWFALTIDGLGLLLGAFGTVVIASYARAGGRWWQPFAVGAALTAMSWLIFVVGLQLRVPLIGDWLGG